jgi:hypothetical protein
MLQTSRSAIGSLCHATVMRLGSSVVMAAYRRVGSGPFVMPARTTRVSDAAIAVRK